MDIIEWLSLVAGLMTMVAPMTQALKTIRSRDVAGLSVASYLLLLGLGTFAVLIGVQYGIVFMALLNGIGMTANVAIMYLLSKRALALFVLALLTFAAVASLAAPNFLPTLITTRWAEQVAFVYGLVAAATFLPQVLMTRRTRQVSAFSMSYLVLFNSGMVIWMVVSVMLGNYSLIFWNGILLAMIAELLRLKVTEEIKQRRTAAQESAGATRIVPPPPIV